MENKWKTKKGVTRTDHKTNMFFQIENGIVGALQECSVHGDSKCKQ